MKFLTSLQFLIILAFPFILFLLVFNVVGFNSTFYQEKFLEYGVQQNVPEADLLHEKVINFIKGRHNNLPNEFNDKEKKHLFDVRKAVKISVILLYVLIALFVLTLIASAFILKVNSYIINFAGKVLVFGGFLTVVIVIALLLLINLDFSSTFNTFHKLLFEKGSYVFDPASDIIVRLYPEELFMELGLRISRDVFLLSAITILIGAFLIFKSKNR